MPAQRAVRKRPGDFTGTNDEKLKSVNEEELLLQAEQMAMVNRVAAVQNSEVVDLTEETRLAHVREEMKRVTESPVPVKVRKHRIRVVADLDEMTFGKNVLAPAEVTEDGMFKEAQIQGLNTISLKEGRQYDVDTPLYEHLKHLGYLYGETCHCQQCQQIYGMSPE
jgi:hypothetical protein